MQSKVTFSKAVGFRKELNRRVDAYFESESIKQRDNFAMYFKGVICLTWMISTWAFIIFVPSDSWIKLLGCVVLGISMAAIAFNIGHDANHGGYSNNQNVNKILSLATDLLGVSSYLWRYRHNVLHHTYTNIVDHDVDIDGEGLVRMSPEQEYRWFHRFQQFYIWILYGFVPLHGFIYDFYVLLIKRNYINHGIPTPKKSDLITFFSFKAFWVAYVIGVPLMLGYSPLEVILGVVTTYMTVGVIMGFVFILAHVVDTADFLTPSPETGRIDDEWAICQVRTTVDFAPKNQVLNWYLGGLNFQAVHHLFPHICHIHYPKLAEIVEEVCGEFGIEYKVHETLAEAIASNYRWLKAMGTPPKMAEATSGVN